jgi:hypothetical protein
MFIDFADIRFQCPHCSKQYEDVDEKYLKCINKNKTWTTKVKCECNKTFSLTVEYTGKFITYV